MKRASARSSRHNPLHAREGSRKPKVPSGWRGGPNSDRWVRQGDARNMKRTFDVAIKVGSRPERRGRSITSRRAVLIHSVSSNEHVAVVRPLHSNTLCRKISTSLTSLARKADSAGDQAVLLLSTDMASITIVSSIAHLSCQDRYKIYDEKTQAADPETHIIIVTWRLY